MKLDFRHGAGRQRVAHGNQANVLVAAVEGGHVQAVLADLQVPAAVNDLRGHAAAEAGGARSKPPLPGGSCPSPLAARRFFIRKFSADLRPVRVNEIFFFFSPLT